MTLNVTFSKANIDQFIEFVCEKEKGHLFFFEKLANQPYHLEHCRPSGHISHARGDFDWTQRFARWKVKEYGESMTLVDRVGGRVFSNHDAVVDKLEKDDLESLTFYRIYELKEWEEVISLIFKPLQTENQTNKCIIC